MYKDTTAYINFIKEIMAAPDCEAIIQIKIKLDKALGNGILNLHDHDVLDQVANKFYDILWENN